MAREATLVLETQPAISMTCDLATGIEKGAICKLTNNMTAALSDGDTDICAGIVQSEHLANRGTKVSIYRGGIFRGYAGAAGVTVGMPIITDVGTGDTNELVNADVNSEQIVGIALETATDGNTFLFELKPMAVNLA